MSHILLTRDLKATWLFHEHDLISWEDTMQKGSFDVELLQIPVKSGSKMQDGVKRFQSGSGSTCLVIVNVILLGIPLCNVVDFVSYNVACVIPFLLANQFSF
jgi:hypothetical protein